MGLRTFTRGKDEKVIPVSELLAKAREGLDSGSVVGLEIKSAQKRMLCARVMPKPRNEWDCPEFGKVLIEVPVSDVNFMHCDLRGIYMRGNFSGLNMYGADLSGSNVMGANFANCFLIHAKLLGAKASYATFEGASASKANFGRAFLYGAIFKNSVMSGAVFTSADVSDANFGFSRMVDVDFFDATMFGTMLSGALLTGACFTRARMSCVQGPGYVMISEFTTQGHPLVVHQRQGREPLTVAGCWSGPLSDLRKLILGDTWPSGADTSVRDQHRPGMLAQLDAVEQLAKVWPDVRNIGKK
jgi:hypothetical protein